MNQTLLVGLGGTGSRIVNIIMKTLQEKKIPVNQGEVTCAVMDTNVNDNKLVKKTGTEIPIIPTSKEMEIDEYIAKYSHLGMMDWCPYTKSFGGESMTDGASEMRVKSRIALMDTMASREIRDLEDVIRKMFVDKQGGKIRVMLVCSLSGGTGSGMFIQMALWLRRFFESKNCQISIRGVFLLPDIFVQSVESIWNNPRKKLYHYANAYAAIRELNTLNKIIQKDYVPERRIVIDDLFDSDKPGNKPVFDYSFFVDNVSSAGADFKTIGEYESVTAQLIYMQLYAPMVDELLSVEDNLYRAFQKSKEPLFGACGTSRAVYPTQSVLKYCAIRAAQDSIAEGWGKIDSEIDAMIQEEEDAIRDGQVILRRISRRDMFMKLFDEKSTKTGTAVTKGDVLFISIKNDIYDEKRDGYGEDSPIIYSCKVKKFLKIISEMIEKIVNERGGCDSILSFADLPDPDSPDTFPSNIVETLKGLRDSEIAVIEGVMEAFKEEYKDYADEIIRAIAPTDMSTVSGDNEESLFGIFVKKDLDGSKHFVHPIAAKYLLYKLQRSIQERLEQINPETAEQSVKEGDKQISFDIEKTKRVVETMKEYWNQIGWHISRGEIQHFIRKYKDYNLNNKTLCVDFETQLLEHAVLTALSERIKSLLNYMEDFFRSLPKMITTLDKDLFKNVGETAEAKGKVYYVNAKMANKDAKYTSLGLDLTARNNDLNESVVKSVYGKFCYQLRSNAKANIPYGEKGIATTFLTNLVDSFSAIIWKDKRDQLDLKLFEAIAEESDLLYKAEQLADPDFADSTDDAFGEENELTRRQNRHRDLVKSYLQKLRRGASPFLIARPAEIRTADADEFITTSTGKVLHMPIQTELTFWGYHPSLVDDYPEIEGDLGGNKTTAAGAGYGKNELYCYSSVYGIKAADIDKFNELKGGDYFTHYDAVIHMMIKDKSEVDTPHLDKTWHEFLPYVSPEKQKKVDMAFRKAIWMAIAYKVITVDAHGKYQLSSEYTDDYGSKKTRIDPILLDGKPVSLTEIPSLVKALKMNPRFEMEIVPYLEGEFRADLDQMTTYESMTLMKALEKKSELNPVTMILRYSETRGSSVAETNQLIGALEDLMKDVASNYNVNRSDDKEDDVKFKLCFRIFSASGRTQGKDTVFYDWCQHFIALKLMSAPKS